MKKNSTKIIIVIFFLIAIAGILRLRSNKSGMNDNNSLESHINKPAPSFTLTDRQGKTYTNESLKGKNVVLFFNEGLACYPACWNQMKELSKDKRLNSEEVLAFSVVTESKEAWKNAASKTSELEGIDVLFDAGSTVSDAFGATSAPSSMHNGVPGHTYFVLDKEGIIRYVYDDPRMGINNSRIFVEVSKLK